MRNLTFEYEIPFINKSIISSEVNYVEQLEKYLYRLAHTFEFCKIDPCFLPFINDQKFTANSNYLDEVITIVDILTTLTNVENVENVCKFEVQLLVRLMEGIKLVYKVKASTKDKIDVVLAIFCKINAF